jgi:hypothetical protein
LTRRPLPFSFQHTNIGTTQDMPPLGPHPYPQVLAHLDPHILNFHPQTYISTYLTITKPKPITILCIYQFRSLSNIPIFAKTTSKPHYTPGYATPILYAWALALKQLKGWLLQKIKSNQIKSNFTKIKGPKCWINTKLNNMRCRKIELYFFNSTI